VAISSDTHAPSPLPVEADNPDRVVVLPASKSVMTVLRSVVSTSVSRQHRPANVAKVIDNQIDVVILAFRDDRWCPLRLTHDATPLSRSGDRRSYETLVPSRRSLKDIKEIRVTRRARNDMLWIVGASFLLCGILGGTMVYRLLT